MRVLNKAMEETGNQEVVARIHYRFIGLLADVLYTMFCNGR
jgi:hypothetical protein